MELSKSSFNFNFDPPPPRFLPNRPSKRSPRRSPARRACRYLLPEAKGTDVAWAERGYLLPEVEVAWAERGYLLPEVEGTEVAGWSSGFDSDDQEANAEGCLSRVEMDERKADTHQNSSRIVLDHGKVKRLHTEPCMIATSVSRHPSNCTRAYNLMLSSLSIYHGEG